MQQYVKYLYALDLARGRSGCTRPCSPKAKIARLTDGGDYGRKTSAQDDLGAQGTFTLLAASTAVDQDAA